MVALSRIRYLKMWEFGYLDCDSSGWFFHTQKITCIALSSFPVISQCSAKSSEEIYVWLREPDSYNSIILKYFKVFNKKRSRKQLSRDIFFLLNNHAKHISVRGPENLKADHFSMLGNDYVAYYFKGWTIAKPINYRVIGWVFIRLLWVENSFVLIYFD